MSAFPGVFPSRAMLVGVLALAACGASEPQEVLRITEEQPAQEAAQGARLPVRSNQQWSQCHGHQPGKVEAGKGECE